MKKTMTLETTIANLSANYVSALRRAETAAATAGQQGAWLIACHMASGSTIDEAFEAVKAFLREKGEGPNAIERSRPLVPFACSLREAGAGNEFPKGENWPTIALAKAVSTITHRTASSVASFAEDMAEAREMARQDLCVAYLAKGIDADPKAADIDKRVVSLASAKRNKSDGGGGDRILDLLRNPEELKGKLSALSDDELDALEEVIEAVRDARNAVGY
jgi:hypothetical protein